ncbi:hypothetical protein GOZ96_24405 [Agrobacterium vitis]|nr:transposase [Agrobacterium vitis]MUZ99699.1 hypothetical protein [Agrobacterium vitis]MVA32516.1 hypothetical protein [Agrobacterium vitis]
MKVARFEVDVPSAVEWSQRYRATGSVHAGKIAGDRKHILEFYGGFIVGWFDQNLHLTPHGLEAELASRSIAVSHSTIWEFIHSEGICRKASYSKTMRVDNGRGVVSPVIPICGPMSIMSLWTSRGLASRPGFIEAFNSKLRSECLNLHWFLPLAYPGDVASQLS